MTSEDLAHPSMCILEDGHPSTGRLLNGILTWMRSGRDAKPKACLMVLVCLALLVMLTMIQVAHVHSVNTDADHCPLCIVLHTAVPVAAAAAIIVLVNLEVLAPVAQVRSLRSTLQRQLFIRPPPSA